MPPTSMSSVCVQSKEKPLRTRESMTSAEIQRTHVSTAAAGICCISDTALRKLEAFRATELTDGLLQ